MAMQKRHRILIATDGSPPAHAALATAVKFPWAKPSIARALVAPSNWLPPNSDAALAALERSFEAVADAARRTLAQRWPAAEAVVVDESPVDAILGSAKRFDATVIVLGWRGHGTFRRLLAGSVSRSVAARAHCPVLVVRAPVRSVRRLVVGFDGCPNAERAVDFVSSLEPARGSHVVLVNVVAPVSLPASLALLPASTRAQIRHAATSLKEERYREAHATVEAGVARLKQAGWRATSDIRVGAPLASLLGAADDHQADILVLGARATSGVERALLGSVANGALNRSRVPVLLVR